MFNSLEEKITREIWQICRLDGHDFSCHTALRSVFRFSCNAMKPTKYTVLFSARADCLTSQMSAKEQSMSPNLLLYTVSHRLSFYVYIHLNELLRLTINSSIRIEFTNLVFFMHFMLFSTNRVSVFVNVRQIWNLSSEKYEKCWAFCFSCLFNNHTWMTFFWYIIENSLMTQAAWFKSWMHFLNSCTSFFLWQCWQ